MKIFHFYIPSPSGNFGDDVLFLSTKKVFEDIFKDFNVTWINYPLRNHTTKNVIKKANECDLILLGGGGLFLKDTAANNYSGWQWACSLEHLKLIRKPLIVFSVGYNKFRGQEDFNSLFTDHLNEVINRSSFFSVREGGSKKALINYGLPINKVKYNPCPSLFFNFGLDKNKDSNINIGINMAGDRDTFRYNGVKFFNNMTKIINQLIAKNYKIHFFNHNWNPKSNCQFFQNEIIDKKIYDIETIWNYKDIKRAISLYNSMDIILAMRSHSQLIPFGQLNKVISIISHDKLKWFLEDVNMSDTGIDVDDPDFVEKILDLIKKNLSSDQYFFRQSEALKRLKVIFKDNCDEIRKIYEGSK